MEMEITMRAVLSTRYFEAKQEFNITRLIEGVFDQLAQNLVYRGQDLTSVTQLYYRIDSEPSDCYESGYNILAVFDYGLVINLHNNLFWLTICCADCNYVRCTTEEKISYGLSLVVLPLNIRASNINQKKSATN
ncbi:MAG: hypothetical protein COX77_02635 [Candidatus Komeilibacteria bacterium CG_4_10_14_0_2_um_filter_37_10]|uniref:Uncharacterized protein n=1 Tax=Candidatus Komeilibacteria bacterium CG_4_10_14_0_2_um_filter_37_10 TaxID=1974470 RepID=A0A2M7VEU4_9BACT|nr:MAG: hypothetical protein COX77_02635 [Candidatus Komeilibacteria bacterium CG_4_10_14_0_2_um_filter_37_10]